MKIPQKVVYRNLSEVLEVLTVHKDILQVRNVLNLCVDTGLIPRKDSNVSSASGAVSTGQGSFRISTRMTEYAAAGVNGESSTRSRYPFIVVEGLDGTGKTTLTRFLASRLQMRLMSTPPKNHDVFIKARDFFDSQEESIRRAYYSLGNYLAANEVLTSDQPVVMDRFWHSTAAYALAHLNKTGECFKESSLEWPTDLLQPEVVIFLQVDEKERLKRHSTRKEFTNTAEEQTLADDKVFRENLVQYYRNIVGPKFHELIVDSEQKESQRRILKAVLTLFPNLELKS